MESVGLFFIFFLVKNIWSYRSIANEVHLFLVECWCNLEALCDQVDLVTRCFFPLSVKDSWCFIIILSSHPTEQNTAINMRFIVSEMKSKRIEALKAIGVSVFSFFILKGWSAIFFLVHIYFCECITRPAIPWRKDTVRRHHGHALALY